ncbi:MAG: ankyrin repeat domain-containing protein, partial [Caldilineaceae bacterium]|nr:ankyrin repeat domain-containing protein [Caldilineaceae bacterium]
MAPQVDRNRTVVTHVLDVYRAEVRKFICKTLEQQTTPQRQFHDLILDALSEDKKRIVLREMSGGNSIGDSIDIGEFPEIMDLNWTLFADKIAYNVSRSTFRRNTIKIRSARNKWAHPSGNPFNTSETNRLVKLIATCLRQIHSTQAARDIEALSSELDQPPAPETFGPRRSLLHQAVSEGDVDAVRAILESGADPNVEDKNGDAPLRWAGLGSEVFKVLLGAGANPNIEYERGNALLHLAVSRMAVDAVKALLRANADPNIEDKNGRAPLHLAVSKVLQQPSPWLQSSHSMTGEVLGLVRTLLGAGADPNLRDKSSTTPLHLAVCGKSVEVVRVLLEVGAESNTQDKGGKTPLHLAEVGSAIFVTLLGAGANPNIQDESGTTPLHLAVSKNAVDAVEALLEAEAEPNVQDQGGNSPLHLAGLWYLAGMGSAVFDALLEAGANPNITFESGKTPLHLAVSGGSAGAVGKLLGAGANPNIQDRQGRMPLHLARLGSVVFDALLETGANPDIAYADGSTPL